MSIEQSRDALLWCTVINYGIILVWLLAYVSARRRIHELWSRWFHLSPEQFDTLSFLGISIYKVGVLLLNLVPYIALSLAG